MTFLYAAHIVKAHGYSSCLLIPNDHLLFTLMTNTLALFASREEMGQVHCIAYSDLLTMNKESVLATLQKPSCPTDTDGQKKRRRASKEAHA